MTPKFRPLLPAWSRGAAGSDDQLTRCSLIQGTTIRDGDELLPGYGLQPMRPS